MEEVTLGLSILGFISILTASIWHAFVIDFNRALIGSSVTAAIAFQIISALYTGHIDAFILIAMVYSSVIALFISIIIGLPYYYQRRNNDHE